MREKTQDFVNNANTTVDIICPTFNNLDLLNMFVASFNRNTFEPWRLVIVNNGDANIGFNFNHPSIHMIQMDSNKGWMGGVNAGIKWCMANNPSKYIGWINDDVQIIDHDLGWLTKMILSFQKPGVGAVGPVSNAVMGYQHSNHVGLPPYIESSRLSGLCFITKKEIIDQVGLLDESLPGGDDLDYSIRIKNAGYKLCICRRTFIMHHYAKTGKRVHGEYWDSQKHVEDIAAALIAKHGFKKYYATINDLLPAPDKSHDFIATEENFAREELAEGLESGKVLDLGCGGKKIHPNAVGVDIRPNGSVGVGVNALYASTGDVASDCVDLKPFENGSVDGILAKHLLEHVIEPIKAVKEWCRVLKDGGKLVIIVPDWRYCEAISCDPSHVAAYTPKSLSALIETIGGFRITKVKEVSPGYVFGISCEKIPVKNEAPVMACVGVS